jgi:hypothetical protein
MHLLRLLLLGRSTSKKDKMVGCACAVLSRTGLGVTERHDIQIFICFKTILQSCPDPERVSFGVP